MKLIKPSFEILNISGDLTTIEQAARTCYKSESKITEGSAEKLVANLLTRGHEAMLEFVDISVKIITDRGVSHEIVRHRVASYAQESTRFINYKEGVTFIEPLSIENSPTRVQFGFRQALYDIEQKYIFLIENGLKPQDARAVLPNALKTEIVMKANLREWRHFFQLRCDKAAHLEMRRITVPMLEEFRKRIPIIFDDLSF